LNVAVAAPRHAARTLAAPIADDGAPNGSRDRSRPASPHPPARIDATRIITSDASQPGRGVLWYN